MPEPRRILLTGATGYIGGRLLQALRQRGETVRCASRDARRLESRTEGTVEVVECNLLERESLGPALEGVHTAYYLVHSMAAGEEYRERDRRAAHNFTAAAEEAGVRRIIYLGGLAHGDDLSGHLASRLEVGEILRGSAVETIEFQASIIIGSGSLSFEMIRALVGKLPVMVAPRWVRTPAQPIAVEDVVEYLELALDVPGEGSCVYEIGGADRASYRDLMMEYARQANLKRWIIPVPVLTPRLSSLWLGLVTPVYARVGRELVEGLRNASVVEDDRALEVFPLRPRSLRAAIARAFVNEDRELAETRWSDALSSSAATPTWVGVQLGSRIVDSRTKETPAPPGDAFAPIRRIGGEAGWYYGDWLWRIRGFLDLLVGGPGLRRGRRDPETPAVGDALDFWRVEAYEENRLLRLRAEMKVPGRAWLEFEVEPVGRGSRVRQTASFDPRGWLGRMYWAALYPLHGLVFEGMLRGVIDRGCQQCKA